MKIHTIQTGSTKVSPAVPNRNVRKSPYAYTGLMQKRSQRITVPVKCFYVENQGHSYLIDAGWSQKVTVDPVGHLGIGLVFASEPIMKPEEAAVNRLRDKKIDCILMTHLDCDHASGLQDFADIPVYTCQDELSYARKQKLRYGNLIAEQNFQLLYWKEDEEAPFGYSCDVFLDGSCIAYMTPTHSAGSVIYKIVDGENFALVVGDNGYQRSSWENLELPGPLYDAANMQKILAWIFMMAQDEKCLGILCAHDPEDHTI